MLSTPSRCFRVASIFIARASTISTLVPLRAAQYGTTFDIAVSFGTQTFDLLVDTGSSDTWVLGDAWQCVSEEDGTLLPRSACAFGNATYHPSASFAPITQAWLGDQYGDGDAIGTLGLEKLRIGNLTVPAQEVGIANVSSTVGDALNVGIIGFGYPAISATHPASHPQNASLLENTLPYSTIFRSLIAEGMDPFISLALERTPRDQEVGFGGYLGLGTFPPVAHGAFVSTPVEPTDAIPLALTTGIRQITEWTLTVNSVRYGANSHSNSPFQAVVDVGNWLTVLPDALAESINQAFSPPAVLAPDAAYYEVSCNATAPSLAFDISNGTFPMQARDMLWRDRSGSCFSSVVAGGPDSDSELMFLGAAWLKNVVAVFDMGGDEMRFAGRGASGGRIASASLPAATQTGATFPAAYTGSAEAMLASDEFGWRLLAVVMVTCCMVL